MEALEYSPCANNSLFILFFFKRKDSSGYEQLLYGFLQGEKLEKHCLKLSGVMSAGICARIARRQSVNWLHPDATKNVSLREFIVTDTTTIGNKVNFPAPQAYKMYVSELVNVATHFKAQTIYHSKIILRNTAVAPRGASFLWQPLVFRFVKCAAPDKWVPVTTAWLRIY